jgi:hypothetical protein
MARPEYPRDLSLFGQKKRKVSRRKFQLSCADCSCLRLLTILAASALLQGCIPIYVRTHQSVPVRESSVPVVPAALSAPKGAGAISIVRPAAEAGNHELYRSIVPQVAGVGAAAGGIVFLIFEHRIFEMSADPAIWAADGLKARLENAGYDVRDVDTVAAAATPIVVTIDVDTVHAEDIAAEDEHESACAVTVDAKIKVIEQQQSRFERNYEGKHQQAAISCLQKPTISLALRKALDDLLDHAFPEIAPVLASAAQAHASLEGQSRHSRQ